jgi:hypothetical protein
MPTALRPNLIAGRIFRSLANHVDTVGQGLALTDNMGYGVPRLPSGRESFSPDVSYFGGAYSALDMKFIQGPPTFAVEVRGEGDYGPAAERAIQTKRADYFAAGTLVVWDVDTIAEKIVAYRHEDPQKSRTYGRGDQADAEPAVNGWVLVVDRVFV